MAQNQHVCTAMCLKWIGVNPMQLWCRSNFIIILKVRDSQPSLGCYVMGGK